MFTYIMIPLCRRISSVYMKYVRPWCILKYENLYDYLANDVEWDQASNFMYWWEETKELLFTIYCAVCIVYWLIYPIDMEVYGAQMIVDIDHVHKYGY